MGPDELALIVVATLVGSFVKSVTGMGYPLIAIPILSLYIGVENAVVIIAIPNTIANLLLSVDVRSAAPRTRDLPILAVTSIVGAVGGVFLLVRVPEEPLLLTLAMAVIVYIVQFWRRPDVVIDPATSRRWAPVLGTGAGVLQGAIGVSGPVVAVWFHGYRLDKDAFVFSLTLFFLVSGTAQAIVLGVTGEYDLDRMGAAALALVATLAMIPVGTRVRDRIDTATFERVILGVLAVSAVALVVQAFG